ncbi:unnamed protein product [Caenorhabditis angaria]|uniref:Uncharacterized protein n=1 Tax=Caenorhabditis angaria TaxID=860376 RepID=A0A9P1MUX4_9PELO|nr:unnamed protein product [Caenorhabditis angaria]
MKFSLFQIVFLTISPVLATLRGPKAVAFGTPETPPQKPKQVDGRFQALQPRNCTRKIIRTANYRNIEFQLFENTTVTETAKKSLKI